VRTSRYTGLMDEKQHSWDADAFQRVLAAHHAEFDETHKVLIDRLEKPLPSFELFKTQSSIQELTALGKQIDANLKALQDLVRSLPLNSSIPD
jgi:hypothetical protein